MAFRFGTGDALPQEVVSDNDVQTIVDAGFPRGAATAALIDTGGDVEAALEMLLAQGPDDMPPELGEEDTCATLAPACFEPSRTQLWHPTDICAFDGCI